VIAAVVMLVRRMRRAQVPQLEEFLAEAGELAKRFDRLLNDKRQLVKATLEGLDARIEELNRLIAEADERIAELKQLGPGAREPSLRDQILAMAAQGKPASEIARATGRSIGEVELVLGLGKNRGR